MSCDKECIFKDPSDPKGCGLGRAKITKVCKDQTESIGCDSLRAGVFDLVCIKRPYPKGSEGFMLLPPYERTDAVSCALCPLRTEGEKACGYKGNFGEFMPTGPRRITEQVARAMGRAGIQIPDNLPPHWGKDLLNEPRSGAEPEQADGAAAESEQAAEPAAEPESAAPKRCIGCVHIIAGECALGRIKARASCKERVGAIRCNYARSEKGQLICAHPNPEGTTKDTYNFGIGAKPGPTTPERCRFCHERRDGERKVKVLDTAVYFWDGPNHKHWDGDRPTIRPILYELHATPDDGQLKEVYCKHGDHAYCRTCHGNPRNCNANVKGMCALNVWYPSFGHGGLPTECCPQCEGIITARNFPEPDGPCYGCLGEPYPYKD